MFILRSAGNAKSIRWQFFSILINSISCLLIGDYVILLFLKVPDNLMHLILLDSGLCIHHFVVWSNLNLLHNSQWITFPIQSCLIFKSFCDNFLHSLIFWLTISSIFIYPTLAILLRIIHFCLNIIGTFDILVWMVLARPPISSSPMPFTKTLGTVSENINYNWCHRLFHVL